MFGLSNIGKGGYNAMTHTPGPWHASTNFRTSGKAPGIDIGAANGANVALVHYDAAEYMDSDRGEVRANARLIAAAPEMLALLERLIEVDANPTADSLDITSVADEARVLLAKIEGKP